MFPRHRIHIDSFSYNRDLRIHWQFKLESRMVETIHMQPVLISMRGVGKTYRDGQVRAVDRVSLEIRSGEYIAIMGRSGCGKSTLLNLLGGLDRPSDGEILFRGTPLNEIGNLDQFRAKEIGFVFQSFYLLPNLTALENVQLPMFQSDLNHRQRAAEARRLLESVGLADRLNHVPGQLSIGQRQRVAIARALANKPSLILADEPTGSLDSQSGEEIMRILSDLNARQGTTLVVVTHDLKVASQAGRILSMFDGRIQVEP